MTRPWRPGKRVDLGVQGARTNELNHLAGICRLVRISARPLQNSHNPLHVPGKQLVQGTCSDRNLLKILRLFSLVLSERRKWRSKRRTGAGRLRRSAPSCGADSFPKLRGGSDSLPALVFVSSPPRMAAIGVRPRLAPHGAGLRKGRGTLVTMTASSTRQHGRGCRMTSSSAFCGMREAAREQICRRSYEARGRHVQ